ncbi:MAG TPA: hypothetical protein VIW69_03965 [Candidatus Elarobacter sp.]
MVVVTPKVVAPKLRSITGAAPAADAQTGFVVEYDGLAGNLPLKYENSASLWEGSIPNPDADPIETQPATSDRQRGNIKFEKDVGRAPYSVTYQVGPKPTTMCALAQINVKNGPPLPLYVSISIVEITTAAVTVMYSTLPGYLPKTNGNWLGV